MLSCPGDESRDGTQATTGTKPCNILADRTGLNWRYNVSGSVGGIRETVQVRRTFTSSVYLVSGDIENYTVEQLRREVTKVFGDCSR